MAGLAWILGGVFALALRQVFIGVWLGRRTRAFLVRARRTTGHFTGEASAATTIDMQGTRYGVIVFTTEDGQERILESRVGLPWKPRAGASVDV